MVTPAARGGAGATETARGPVQGYVATRSATGTKTDAALIETPQAISVVTRDQIQAQGAQNVGQAIRYTSGVVAEGQGADQRFDDVYVRGFLADKYLDGLKLVSGGFAYTIVDPYNLERVEVLHGPASVLYGQASPGGLVNMVSKLPTETPIHEMFFSTGSYGRVQAGVDLGGPLNQDGSLLYRFTGSGYDVGSQVDHAEYERVSLAPSLTWRPDNDTKFTVLGSYQNDPKAGFFNQLLPGGIGTLTPYLGARIPTSFYPGDPGFDVMRRTNASIGYQFEHRFDQVWTVRQNLRYSDNQTYIATVYPDGTGVPTSIGRGAFAEWESLHALQVDTQAEAKFSTGILQHTLLFGVDYLTGSDTQLYANVTGDVPNINAFAPVYGLNLTVTPTGTGGKQNFDQVGVYVQDQIKVDRWVALFGVRWDDATAKTTSIPNGLPSSQNDTATTKRAALLYKFDNGVAPYVQYTESFQPVVGMDLAGNPFKPTTGQQEEVGIKYQPNARVLLTAALFNLTQQNVKITDPNNVLNAIQVGEIRSRGVELEAKAQISRELTMLASYTYLDLVNTVSDPVSQGKRPYAIPANTASAWADYTFHNGALDGFGLAGGVRYLGPSAGDSANTFKIPGVTLFDAAMHYDLSSWGAAYKGVQLSLNVTNLFDKTYVSVCQDYGCFYGLRRAALASVRYRW